MRHYQSLLSFPPVRVYAHSSPIPERYKETSSSNTGEFVHKISEPTNFLSHVFIIKLPEKWPQAIINRLGLYLTFALWCTKEATPKR